MAKYIVNCKVLKTSFNTGHVVYTGREHAPLRARVGPKQPCGRQGAVST